MQKGVPMGTLKSLHQRLGTDHALSLALKKSVSWALRAIGRRSRALNAAAVAVSRRLARSADAPSRWVGKDALRELASPRVCAKLSAAPAQASRAAT